MLPGDIADTLPFRSPRHTTKGNRRSDSHAEKSSPLNPQKTFASLTSRGGLQPFFLLSSCLEAAAMAGAAHTLCDDEVTSLKGRSKDIALQILTSLSH